MKRLLIGAVLAFWPLGAFAANVCVSPLDVANTVHTNVPSATEHTIRNPKDIEQFIANVKSMFPNARIQPMDEIQQWNSKTYQPNAWFIVYFKDGCEIGRDVMPAQVKDALFNGRGA